MNFGKYKEAKKKRIKETELLMTSLRGHIGKPMKYTSNAWMTCGQTHQYLIFTYNKKTTPKVDFSHISTFLLHGKSTYFTVPAFSLQLQWTSKIICSSSENRLGILAHFYIPNTVSCKKTPKAGSFQYPSRMRKFVKNKHTLKEPIRWVSTCDRPSDLPCCFLPHLNWGLFTIPGCMWGTDQVWCILQGALTKAKWRFKTRSNDKKKKLGA